ncbi:uncharacterized protein EV420DRAFT_1767139 [Desarmillaria tabescens]|uniref:Uncharacterized protein n=1 Tax=Armillaria tabescens TaxID=1929756 RepID=A0AA39JUL8_ARMTA|nr:uncharacterized protein EV420DRAFT_1767139 [Desarmillaria tabescens]KAK0449093.1 hypothetical protein EV420DRAFT_1767139 [Desarmillaria tabescens]
MLLSLLVHEYLLEFKTTFSFHSSAYTLHEMENYNSSSEMGMSRHLLAFSFVPLCLLATEDTCKDVGFIPGNFSAILDACYMYMQTIIPSEIPNVQSSIHSNSDSSTYPLKESIMLSILSTSPASDTATIRSSFTASLVEASITNYCPSFYPDVPANEMQPSISILLSSIASKDDDSLATDSEASSASLTPLNDTPTTTSADTFPSLTPSPPPVTMGAPSPQTSVSNQLNPVSTATKPSYCREHTIPRHQQSLLVASSTFDWKRRWSQTGEEQASIDFDGDDEVVVSASAELDITKRMYLTLNSTSTYEREFAF